MSERRRPAFPLVLSGPSGAGKTSVAQWLLENEPDVVSSVSCTTRERRGQELEGIDYFYLAEQEFLDRRDRGEFLEWALVHGHLYGTPKTFLERQTEGGKIVLLDIDVQGAMQIKRSGIDAVLVFLMPPSMDDLEQRLRGRHTDSEDVIERRLAAARREMETAPEYDYLIVNHDLDTTRRAVHAVVEAERAKAHRVLRLNPVTSDPILSEVKARPFAKNLERK